MTAGTPSTTAFTAADFADLGACRLLPDLTAGPFPTVTEVERRDVTEGLTGMPLRVGIQVVDESCAPIPGATVEIWHCDVDGDYSGYADGGTDDDGGEGTTFLRGSQVANDEGIVEFLTIWPGWYRGRAVHIHSKVHIDGATVLTTQFLFDDGLNSEVLATGRYAVLRRARHHQRHRRSHRRIGRGRRAPARSVRRCRALGQARPHRRRPRRRHQPRLSHSHRVRVGSPALTHAA